MCTDQEKITIIFCVQYICFFLVVGISLYICTILCGYWIHICMLNLYVFIFHTIPYNGNNNNNNNNKWLNQSSKKKIFFSTRVTASDVPQTSNKRKSAYQEITAYIWQHIFKGKFRSNTTTGDIFLLINSLQDSDKKKAIFYAAHIFILVQNFQIKLKTGQQYSFTTIENFEINEWILFFE